MQNPNNTIRGRRFSVFEKYEDLRTEIEKFSVGSEIILTILRESKLFDVPLRLTAIN